MPEQPTETRSSWARAGFGVDTSPQARPGVPMYAPRPRAPEASEWHVPARQAGGEQHLKRAGLKRITPVFGTATPLHGVSGVMRRLAYRYPEDLARRWMMLLVADRVDLVEDRVGGLLERPLQAAGLAGLGRAVHRNPFGSLAMVFTAGWLARRMMA